jgi:hypothetical protein
MVKMVCVVTCRYGHNHEEITYKEPALIPPRFVAPLIGQTCTTLQNSKSTVFLPVEAAMRALQSIAHWIRGTRWQKQVEIADLRPFCCYNANQCHQLDSTKEKCSAAPPCSLVA